MEEKIKEILSLKAKNSYCEEESMNWDNVKLKAQLAIYLDENHKEFVYHISTKLKNIYSTSTFIIKESQNHFLLFEMIIPSLPFLSVSGFYQNLKDLMDFSRGYLTFFDVDYNTLSLSFSKKYIFDVDTCHKRLTALIIENNQYFNENFPYQMKVLWEYDRYFKFQLDIAGIYLTINYLGTNYVEIRNINDKLTSNSLDQFLRFLMNAFYHENLSSKERNRILINVIDPSNTYFLLERCFEQALKEDRKKLVMGIKKERKIALLVDFEHPRILELGKDIVLI